MVDETMPNPANPQETETPATPAAATTEPANAATEVAAPAPNGDDRLSLFEKQLAEKDKYIGKMQMEVGETRKMLQQQAQRQAELENYLQQQANPPRDWESEVNQIAAQIDEGLPPGEALKLATQIAYERAVADGEKRTMSLLERQQQQSQMQAMENDFISKFPDYPDFLQSGEKEKLAAEHPFFNDGPLAYFEYKRREESAKAAAKYEEGKKLGMEETKRLLQGTGKGQNVLQDPGSAASRVAPPPMTLEQKKANFIARYNAGEFRK